MYTNAREQSGQGTSVPEEHRQEPFTRVAPVLKCALLMGAGGGFLLAAVLTLASTSSLSPALSAWRWQSAWPSTCGRCCAHVPDIFCQGVESRL